MNTLTYKEIRDKYIKFFKKNSHEEILNSPLVPENDPSVLFVNAGMTPLVPFLKGESHPKGKKLVNIQRCLRTVDIENVGDKIHCTTFDMLGNWSLNDYFKKEAIELTLRFFTEELGLDIKRIYATVFKGDDTAPKDIESIEIWENLYKKYGIDSKKEERILEKGKEDNWWELPTGGPCGPDSEIFYEVNNELVEIGNNVFMQYLKEEDNYKPLGRHNVDFGGGLDRLACICQNVGSIYETDIYKPIFQKVKELSINENTKSQRIITDHIKAATWIVMDGVEPSRTEQGYILRRLIRRAVRHGKLLGINKPFTKEIASAAIEQFSSIYPKLEEDKDRIINTIEEEELKFNRTLENGLKELDKTLEREDGIDGKKAFQLYETYGLPIEVTEEILQEKKKSITNKDAFYKAEKQHQEQSRTSSKGMFKGGLSDTSDTSVRYHTATHLLLAALRKILGNHVYQKGSNITPERLRIDFPNQQKLTSEEAEQVENLVNEAIDDKLEITYEEKSKEEALKIIEEHSSSASFSERYGDVVKVYYIGPKENPFSVEICNGPHVKNTSELGKFKITKQENIGSGIKRIKAILE